MRIIHPVQGEQRKRKEFLLLPRTIGRETRWLETAEWIEEYGENYVDAGWNAIRWADSHDTVKEAK